MKRCSKCGVEKALPEFNADRGNTSGVSYYCKACAKLAASNWYYANKERVAEAAKAYYQGNKEAFAKRDKAKDKKAKSAYDAEYRRRNSEKRAAQQKAWTERNFARVAANKSAYRVRKLSACPAWANKFFIQEAYALAKLRTQTFGFPWHVDHIVPVSHPLVCGLHVEHNLQVIPAKANLSKKNSRWPDMPE